jgi:FKBP-type peptidyl-prolyl cis-trans isomerase SlyD
VSDPDGNLVDEGSEPLVYLHGGFGGIFSRIEEALEGSPVGADFTVKLQPEEAFGEYDPELVMVESSALFPDDIQVGMRFERIGDDGEEERVFTITDIAEDKVVVDGNHPLAGTALVFACVVSEVRPATAEEIAHGHVHGSGGHRH